MSTTIVPLTAIVFGFVIGFVDLFQLWSVYLANIIKNGKTVKDSDTIITSMFFLDIGAEWLSLRAVSVSVATSRSHG